MDPVRGAFVIDPWENKKKNTIKERATMAHGEARDDAARVNLMLLLDEAPPLSRPTIDSFTAQYKNTDAQTGVTVRPPRQRPGRGIEVVQSSIPYCRSTSERNGI